MPPVQMAASASGLIAFGTTLVFAIAGNFILRKTQVTIFGFALSYDFVHVILGPLLVFVNSAIFIFCAMLSFGAVSDDDIILIKSQQTWWVLGPIFNPFFVSENSLANSVGYAFMILLWWVGMHCFWHSSTIGDATPFTKAWSYLITALYLVIGLMSMLAIQACWIKFGKDQYYLKLFGGFIGIGLGTFLPPLLLKADLQKYAHAVLGWFRNIF